jgi:hypothetical protein
LVLKLDFEKVFDNIEHTSIMENLKAKGFGEKWIKWIDIILSSGTSALLLNDVPGKNSLQKRSWARRSTLSFAFCPSSIFFNPY